MAVVGLSSCKTEFEKVRESNDPKLIYEQAMKYYEAEEWLKAQTLFELVLNTYRGRKESEDLYFAYANSYYNLKQYILASHYFETFSTTFGYSDKKEEADFMAAYSNYQMSPSYKLDQQYTMDAIDGFQRFVNMYPYSERAEECNKLIDELRGKMEKKAIEEASLYRDLKRYQAAIHVYDNILKEFPETERAEEIRYYMVLTAYNLAENSVYEKKKERYEAVLNAYKIFTKKYPKSKYRKELIETNNQANKALKSLS